MKVSVIIPTFNEKQVLEDCIESLGAQTLKDFEIIVVDDASTDATINILENLKVSLSNFQFYKQEHGGAGAARNLGAKHAKGEILVFVDADMTFEKDFLEKLIKPIVKGEAKGTFSREEYVKNWDNAWARCWSYNEGWEMRRRHPTNYPDHQPVFRAILKSEFDKVKGFTPGGYMDDWSLSQKLGYEAVVAPGAVFYHANPSSLSEIYTHSKWVAKRKYKLGFLGELFALLRASFPVSIVVGFYKYFRYSEPAFPLFKIVYDFGIFVGILEYICGKSYK